jgi:hypothetical protein
MLNIMKKLFLGIALMGILVLLNACVTCTTGFNSILLSVTDVAGIGINGVEVTVTLLRTGKVLNTGQTFSNGTYIVADDLLKEEFSRGKDVLYVVGEKDTKKFQVQIEVQRTDCGVLKISGPESVILQ